MQTKWDVGFCKTFCQDGNQSLGRVSHAGKFASKYQEFNGRLKELSHPQKQTENEQKVDGCGKFTFVETYKKDEDIKSSLSNIVENQFKQTLFSQPNAFLAGEGTLFNTHTRTLLEGYTDPKSSNQAGIGIKDFEDKMVLRFANEHEISLYFDIVEQLTQLMSLKGHRVLLDNEHYRAVMSSLVDVSKDFLLFLCKDEAYGLVKN